MATFLRKNNQFLCKMEDSSKPIVAAIDGFALGGGLELAMVKESVMLTSLMHLGMPFSNLHCLNKLRSS
jgi:enoyl-CoA hydratase/carnithine racemase